MTKGVDKPIYTVPGRGKYTTFAEAKKARDERLAKRQAAGIFISRFIQSLNTRKKRRDMFTAYSEPLHNGYRIVKRIPKGTKIPKVPVNPGPKYIASFKNYVIPV
jgi:hypothetical protein